MKRKSIFIAWTSFQRRQESMADVFDFTIHYFGRAPGKGLRKVFGYLKQAIATFKVLWRSDPQVVWIQLPPTPLLWVVVLYRSIRLTKVQIVADCHNSMLRRPWSGRWSLGALRLCDVVLFHNEQIAKDATAFGVPSERIVVLEDAPATLSQGPLAAVTTAPRPWFVFPASFSLDEPIQQLVEAARSVPQYTVIITGKPRSAVQRQLVEEAPRNVVFTGYLSREAFDSLVGSSDVVIALTRLHNCQLSACNEAVGCEKPMLLSSTETLKEMFSEAGAVFVDSDDPESIAEGMRRLGRDIEHYTTRSRAFLPTRWARWTDEQASRVIAHLEARRVA